LSDPAVGHEPERGIISRPFSEVCYPGRARRDLRTRADNRLLPILAVPCWQIPNEVNISNPAKLLNDPVCSPFFITS
jgi:hypothetical protein